MKRLTSAGQMLHEAANTAFVLEIRRAVGAFVDQANVNPTVEERQLAQPLGEGVEMEVEDAENRAVGNEGDLGSAPIGRRDRLDRALRSTTTVALSPDLPLATNLQLEAFRERIDHRHADAVESTRDLVDVVVEFTARVELGHNDLGGRATFTQVMVDRNTAPVVLDRRRTVGVESDLDQRAITSLGFVDRVVDELEDHVVETGIVVGVSDVHARAGTYRLEALQNFDRIGPIRDSVGCHGRRHVDFRRRNVGRVVFFRHALGFSDDRVVFR